MKETAVLRIITDKTGQWFGDSTSFLNNLEKQTTYDSLFGMSAEDAKNYIFRIESFSYKNLTSQEIADYRRKILSINFNETDYKNEKLGYIAFKEHETKNRNGFNSSFFKDVALEFLANQAAIVEYAGVYIFGIRAIPFKKLTKHFLNDMVEVNFINDEIKKYTPWIGEMISSFLDAQHLNINQRQLIYVMDANDIFKYTIDFGGGLYAGTKYLNTGKYALFQQTFNKSAKLYDRDKTQLETNTIENFNKIKSHNGYIGDAIFGRGSKNAGDINYSSGGCSLIVNYQKYHNELLVHEIGHHMTNGWPRGHKQPLTKHLDNSAGVAILEDDINKVVQDFVKLWRGYGEGIYESFLSHPQPEIITQEIFCSPQVYGVENVMPKSYFMNYFHSKAKRPFSIYTEMSGLGATNNYGDPPIQGQGNIFDEEAFFTTLEFTKNPSVLYDRIVINKKSTHGELFNDVKNTKTYFMLQQYLWGSFFHTDSGFPKNLKLYNSTAYYSSIFNAQEIKQYKTPYEDIGNSEILKIPKNLKDINGGNPTHHLDTKVLDNIGFEYLEDVIEVFNGQPIKNSTGEIRKNKVVISKAQGATPSELLENYTANGSDFFDSYLKIKSLLGGYLFSHELEVKDDQGQKHCKYVYIITRDAFDLDSLQDTLDIEDDVGNTFGLQ